MIPCVIIVLGWLLGMDSVQAQNHQVFRVREIITDKDTIRLDTLSIVPGSMIVSISGKEVVDSKHYRVDAARSVLIFIDSVFFSERIKDKPLRVSYRVFPLLFTGSTYRKKTGLINTSQDAGTNPFVYRYENRTEDVFKWGSITRSGNISRGVSFGNNQDVVVNSSLNLQLSGYLSEDIQVLAAITDNNIPVQPDGNTQQIQEFDKVYIQLFNSNNKLIAGDFELQRPESYFMNFYKKAQGGLIESAFKIKSRKNAANDIHVWLKGSGALSKGRYARNIIPPLEGNQGPYKLTGVNNENYIIVIAGTERVYIDGIPLTRGQENDYVIDYNLGEITFTPRRLITKDSRIEVEFEYTDRYYARTMFFVGAGMRYRNLDVKFHFFSEQDLKNQPLQQELTERDKQVLRNVGDSLQLAIIPNVDSTGFSPDMVMYKMVDTLVNMVLYDSVFVYSTSPDSAFYRLGFSFLGPGRGNYILVQSAANGRVFRWVAPQNGSPAGDYEPVVLLVSPKRKQMYTLSADYRLGKTTRIYVEGALSDNNLNTFSSEHKADDMGYAAKVNIDSRFPFAPKSARQWKFVTILGNEWVYKHFSPIERYRPVEFNRDWNFAATIPANENMANLKVGVENIRNQYAYYQARYFLHGSQYSGLLNQLDLALDHWNFFLAANASYLYTGTPVYSTRYLRQKIKLTKKFKWFSIGAGEEQEHNLFIPSAADSLMPNSFAFNVYEAFITSPDSARNRFQFRYSRRFDRLPYGESLLLTTDADNFDVNVELTRNPRNILRTGATYRILRIRDTLLSKVKPDDLLVGRIEFYTRKLGNVITSTTYYEVGSGLEERKEYSYIEVPAGQGVYVWTDYNGDGIRQLNEFDVAAFKDQANYIRVFSPTNSYIHIYTNQFSEALSIDPGQAWSKSKGFRKFVSRWALMATYSVSHKTTDDNLLRAYNPFRLNVDDSNLVSVNTLFKTTLFFNKSNPRFGAEATYQLNHSKMLLLNGFELREQESYGLKLRWNITRKFYTNLAFGAGNKRYDSEYFSARDYNIRFWEIEPRFIFQPGTKMRISTTYNFSDKLNTGHEPAQHALIHNVGLEFKYNFPSKGSLQAKANYIDIKYNDAANTSLAYEMLAGFKPGQNITWNLTFQRSIANNLQLDLIYDGRKTGGNKIVHVGSIQVRAYF